MKTRVNTAVHFDAEDEVPEATHNVYDQFGCLRVPCQGGSLELFFDTSAQVRGAADALAKLAADMEEAGL